VGVIPQDDEGPHGELFHPSRHLGCVTQPIHDQVRIEAQTPNRSCGSQRVGYVVLAQQRHRHLALLRSELENTARTGCGEPLIDRAHRHVGATAVPQPAYTGSLRQRSPGLVFGVYDFDAIRFDQSRQLHLGCRIRLQVRVVVQVLVGEIGVDRGPERGGAEPLLIEAVRGSFHHHLSHTPAR